MMIRILLLTSFLACSLTIAICSGQEYRSSVVGTDFDFITADDLDAFMCLEYKFKGYREMPDKTQPSPLVQEGYVFVAYFSDGTSIDMAIDADFRTTKAAEAEARRYVRRLGKLPTELRKGLKRMVVHQGDATAFGGDGCIILYSENATKRIATKDLEETIFHESIHAAWDNEYAQSKEWIEAQNSDGQFITDYARKRPDKEDLAESALFAYTLIHHPDRIPQEETERIRAAIPARIAFIQKRLPRDKPIHYQVAPRYSCDGSGKTFVVEQQRFDESMAEFKKDMQHAKMSNKCTVDLAKPGKMSDILSNALMRGFKIEEKKVQIYLNSQRGKHADGDLLLKATAAKFKIDAAELRTMVEEYRHVNCKHGPVYETTYSQK